MARETDYGPIYSPGSAIFRDRNAGAVIPQQNAQRAAAVAKDEEAANAARRAALDAQQRAQGTTPAAATPKVAPAPVTPVEPPPVDPNRVGMINGRPAGEVIAEGAQRTGILPESQAGLSSLNSLPRLPSANTVTASAPIGAGIAGPLGATSGAQPTVLNSLPRTPSPTAPVGGQVAIGAPIAPTLDYANDARQAPRFTKLGSGPTVSPTLATLPRARKQVAYNPDRSKLFVGQ